MRNPPIRLLLHGVREVLSGFHLINLIPLPRTTQVLVDGTRAHVRQGLFPDYFSFLIESDGEDLDNEECPPRREGQYPDLALSGLAFTHIFGWTPGVSGRVA